MNRLNVFFNGDHIGRYDRYDSGEETFEYTDEWLEGGFDLSLSLPRRDETFRGKPVRDLFANTLPDSASHRRTIAENVQANGTNTFDLLYEIGRDCVGSFQFLPDGETPNQPWDVDVRPLDEEDVAATVQSLDANPLGNTEDPTFRISLAGNHEKTSLLHYNGQWNVPLNTTPSSHIFKPQNSQKSAVFDLDENEYFCLKLADNLGLDVPDVQFKRYGRKTCLIIERFDRAFESDGAYRVHTEEFCQALGRSRARKGPDEGEDLMQACFKTLESSEDVRTDQLRFIQQHIYQWFIGADDGHLKNFAFRISDGKAPEQSVRLAPFYDISSGEPYNKDNPAAPDEYPYPTRERTPEIHIDPSLVIPLAGSKKQDIDRIQPQDFVDLAKHCSVSSQAIEESLEAFAEALPDAFEQTVEETSDVVPTYVTEPVEHGINQRIQSVVSPDANTRIQSSCSPG